MSESNQTSVTVERARQYFAEVRERDLEALPLTILQRVNAELLRHGQLLLDVIDDIYLPIPEPLSEKARRAAELLAEVPESLRAAPAHRHHDSAWAVSTLISTLSADSAAEVTRWLRAAAHRRAVTFTVFAKPWEHGWELRVAGVGVTQSYTLDDAEMMARDLIMINREGPADVPEPDFDVVIRPEILTAEQRETIRQALADALGYRERKSYVKCADCEASPTSLCEDHAADFDCIERYSALARELGIEVTP